MTDIVERLRAHYSGDIVDTSLSLGHEAAAEILALRARVAELEAGRDGIPLDDLMLLSAFRYSLGRMTYIVGHVATVIRDRAASLSRNTRELIIREITSAETHNRLGMAKPCVEEWKNLRSFLVSLPAPPPGGQ